MALSATGTLQLPAPRVRSHSVQISMVAVPPPRSWFHRRGQSHRGPLIRLTTSPTSDLNASGTPSIRTGSGHTHLPSLTLDRETINQGGADFFLSNANYKPKWRRLELQLHSVHEKLAFCAEWRPRFNGGSGTIYMTSTSPCRGPPSHLDHGTLSNQGLTATGYYGRLHP